MATRTDANTDGYSRATNLPALNAVTGMGWFYMSVARYGTCFDLRTGGGSRLQIGLDGETNLQIFSFVNGGSDTFGSAITTGVWYHIAFTCTGVAGTDFKVYLNGALDIQNEGRTGAASSLHVNNTIDFNVEWFNGRVSAVKIYDAVLTQPEIANEMRQILPLRTVNLNGFYPMTDGITIGNNVSDLSGLGRNWTSNGTLAIEHGPPVPWSSKKRLFSTIGDPPSNDVPVVLNPRLLKFRTGDRILKVGGATGSIFKGSY